MMPPVLGNAIVILLLAAAVALAVRSLWRDRKRGGACGGSCCGCPNSCVCHPQEENPGGPKSPQPRE